MVEIVGTLGLLAIWFAWTVVPRLKPTISTVQARLQRLFLLLSGSNDGRAIPNFNPEPQPQRRSTAKMSAATFQERIERNAPVWFSNIAFDADTGNILIAGRKGSGKSTLAYALLATRARAGQKVVVLDPHANFNDWPVPAIGGGRDFDGIERALQSLMTEFHRRYGLSKTDVLEPLTIFIDEMPSIKEYCQSAKQFFLAGAREFRKINMTLVILTQSANVKSLGIEGEGDSKLNFVLIYLAGKAIDRMPNEPALRQFARPAVLEQDGFCYPVDLSQPFVAGLARLPISSDSVWQSQKEILDLQLLTDSSDSSDPFDASSEGGTMGTDRPEPLAELLTPDPERTKMEAIAIKAWAAAGLSRTAMARFLGGRKADRLAQIKQILEVE